jgi:hypothetical protein
MDLSATRRRLLTVTGVAGIGFRRRSTGASTAVATTRPGSSRRSVPAYATRSTSTA